MNKVFLFIIFLVSSFSAIAQETLSLEQAIIKGLQNNYDIRIQKRQTEIAENNNSLGEAGYMPNVSVQVNQNNVLTNNVKIANPFQLQGQITSHSLNPQLNLNWQLFQGLKAHISKNRLETLQEEAYGNADIAVANTIQAIILGYFRAVLEEERLEEFQKQLKFSADRFEYISIKADVGAALTYDKLLEETNYLTDSADYINQQLIYQNALRDLNFLMGEKEITTEYELVSKLKHAVQDYTYDNLKINLMNGNVDLKKQYLSQRILDYDLSLRRAERYPTVSLNAGYSDNRGLNNLSNAYQVNSEGVRQYGPADPLSSVTDVYFANFSVSFTLFNGSKINRAIENALIREDIENLSAERLESSLSRDLANAVANYDVKKQLYLINQKKEQVARVNLDLSEDKYKNGTISSFDYRIIQNNYFAASTQQLQALYNLIDAEISILRLTGGIMEYIN